MIINKQQVAMAFAQAAAHYNQYAEVQSHVCQQLATLLTPHLTDLANLPNLANFAERANPAVAGVSPSAPQSFLSPSSPTSPSLTSSPTSHSSPSLHSSPTSPSSSPPNIVDAGCGTGFADHIFSARWPGEARQLLSIDIAMAMLQQHPATDKFKICADLERLPLSDNSVHLYWSSLCWQWCDIDLVLAEAHRCLMPNGEIYIATLLPQTFHELRTIYQQNNIEYNGLIMYQQAKILSAFNVYFNNITCIHQPITLYFPDFKSLVYSIKNVGAHSKEIGVEKTAARKFGLMGRERWQKLSQSYEKLRQAEGLPLTYDVLYIKAINNSK